MKTIFKILALCYLAHLAYCTFSEPDDSTKAVRQAQTEENVRLYYNN